MLLLRSEDGKDNDWVRKGRKRKVDIYVYGERRIEEKRRREREREIEREWERWKERERKIDR